MKLFSIINRKDWIVLSNKIKEIKYLVVFFLKHFQKKSYLSDPVLYGNEYTYVCTCVILSLIEHA